LARGLLRSSPRTTWQPPELTLLKRRRSELNGHWQSSLAQSGRHSNRRQPTGSPRRLKRGVSSGIKVSRRNIRGGGGQKHVNPICQFYHIPAELPTKSLGLKVLNPGNQHTRFNVGPKFGAIFTSPAGKELLVISGALYVHYYPLTAVGGGKAFKQWNLAHHCPGPRQLFNHRLSMGADFLAGSIEEEKSFSTLRYWVVYQIFPSQPGNRAQAASRSPGPADRARPWLAASRPRRQRSAPRFRRCPVTSLPG
jgi:hypothetical protein